MFVDICLLSLIFIGTRNAFYTRPLCDFIEAVTPTVVFYFVFNKHLKKRDQRLVKINLHGLFLDLVFRK